MPPASTMKRTLPATNKERALRTRDPRSGGAYVVDVRDNACRIRAPGPHAHGNAAGQVVDGLRTEVCGQQKTVKRPPQQPTQPQYTNYWAPLTRKWHTMPHPAQPQHTNHWAPRTRKRHQPEHRPQRPTESSEPTQHAKGRTGDCPGPRKETTTRRNVTRGGGGGLTMPSTPLYAVSGSRSTVSLPLHCTLTALGTCLRRCDRFSSCVVHRRLREQFTSPKGQKGMCCHRPKAH